MLNTMYRLTVCLIAAVFIFNSAVSLAWVDLPAELAMATDHHHGSVADDHYDAHARQVGSDLIAATPDHSETSKHIDKCCRTCTVAGVVGDVAMVAVTFSYAAVAFQTGRHDLVGHLVVLDPDIPKYLV